jgi:hypothetical protein
MAPMDRVDRFVILPMLAETETSSRRGDEDNQVVTMEGLKLADRDARSFEVPNDFWRGRLEGEEAWRGRLSHP